MNEPRTIREALASQMFGELDGIITRVEALPKLVANAQEQLAVTVKTLNDANSAYQDAVTLWSEKAKKDLEEYLNRKAVEVTSKSVEEQRAAIQEAARMAFRSEASDKAHDLGKVLSEAAKDFRRSVWSRMVEHAVTALIASGFTASLVFVVLKFVHPIH